MSRHPSYGKSGNSGQKRNVLKRYERIDAMRTSGKWIDGEDKKVTGLPKTKVAK
jgi:small basic protein (TIGR04137 family)